MLDLNNLDLSNKIKALSMWKVLDLSVGSDHLDIIAITEYGDYDYWYAIAIYNTILNPFDLIDQGVNSVKLFDKTEFDNLVRSYNNG